MKQFIESPEVEGRQHDKVDVYINGIQHLPPSPSLMVKLLAVFKQPNPDIEEVADLIAQDPALTSEVLKRCNSAALGGEQPVLNMFEAISRLGFYQVYSIVVMIAGKRTMSLESASSVVQLERLWRHSQATAVVAGIIAKQVRESEPTAFTAGLLHDVGKVVFISTDGAKHAQLVKEAESSGAPLFELEKRQFGFNHADAGARLLERWRLPPEVVFAVRYHHNPAGAGEASRMAAAISFADAVSNGARKISDEEIVARNLETLKLLNMTGTEATRLMQRVQQEIEKQSGLSSGGKMK